MENNKLSFGKVLSIICGLCGFAIGAALWLIPYHGYAINNYADIVPVLLLSIASIFAIALSFGIATTPRDKKSFHKGLFIGNFVSIAMSALLLFTNNAVGPNSTIIWADSGQAEYIGEERVYPFWNNDFAEVYNTTDSVTYSMDQRCGENICTVEATVLYSIDESFVVAKAGSIRNYNPIVDQALTEAVIRDEAYGNLADLQAAVCRNVKAQVGLSATADCPMNMRVSLSASER